VEENRVGLKLNGTRVCISQEAVATHAQRTSHNLEDLHFILLDVVVDRAPIRIGNRCSGRNPYNLHVFITTRAPDLLSLYQRGLWFVHSVRVVRNA
jgi:hypothetical protein